ncbi:MAG TPA: hypothetical protein VIM57_00485 [Luteolibacter sp.]
MSPEAPASGCPAGATQRSQWLGLIYDPHKTIPKLIALLLVSIAGAWLMFRIDAYALTKLDSMSAAAYVEKRRAIHHHSFVFHFLLVLMLGGFYFGIVEFLSYLIGGCFKKKSAA